MSLAISVTTAGFELIASGSLMTINNLPIQFAINAGISGVLLVNLSFHSELHQAGRGMELKLDKEQGAMNINLYDCDADFAVYNATPMHIISYVEEAVERGIYLQMNLSRMRSNGPILIHHAWFVGEPPELETRVC